MNRPPQSFRSRSRNPADPQGNGASPRGRSWPGQDGAPRVTSGNARARHAKYLEMARQAKTAGDEVGEQTNLQYAEHWYRTANADHDAVDSGSPADVRFAE